MASGSRIPDKYIWLRDAVDLTAAMRAPELWDKSAISQEEWDELSRYRQAEQDWNRPTAADGIGSLSHLASYASGLPELRSERPPVKTKSVELTETKDSVRHECRDFAWDWLRDRLIDGRLAAGSVISMKPNQAPHAEDWWKPENAQAHRRGERGLVFLGLDDKGRPITGEPYLDRAALKAELLGEVAERVSGEKTVPDPAKQVSDGKDEAPRNDRRPASATALKSTVKALISYGRQKEYLAFTRYEAIELLYGAYEGNTKREPIRKVVAAHIEVSARRRTQRQLDSRPNELEDCRQFLRAAI